jgi:hypothetical protein
MRHSAWKPLHPAPSDSVKLAKPINETAATIPSVVRPDAVIARCLWELLRDMPFVGNPSDRAQLERIGWDENERPR